MGIEIAKKEQKLGIRASSTCTLNFDDLKIPAENIIGGEGQGYKVPPTCVLPPYLSHSISF
jgi:alkylation response protein AidB-like acyl-CoA dehydrogenase